MFLYDQIPLNYSGLQKNEPVYQNHHDNENTTIITKRAAYGSKAVVYYVKIQMIQFRRPI